MKILPPLELDVRPLATAQRPPLPAILAAVNQLQTGQEFRLIAPFEPTPLYDLLGKKGFSHEARHRADDAWEIIFRPRGAGT